MADLKRKLAAGTTEAKIKGVYDLLLTRDAQSRVSAFGKGEYESLDAEGFGAMRGDLSFPLPFFPSVLRFLLTPSSVFTSKRNSGRIPST